MKKCLIVFTFFIACGPTDEQPDPNLIPDNSCTVIPGLPESGEYYVICPDGAKVRLKTDKDNDDTCTIIDNGDETKTVRCPDGTMATFPNDSGKGEKGETGETGDKGASIQINERELQPGDANCPEGGKAIDFFVEGKTTPSATNYQCNPLNGGCETNQELDSALGYCIPFFEVEFEGRITESMVDELPLSIRPNTTDTCSGRISFPTGLVPTSFESVGLGGFDASYIFGHVAKYGIKMKVDNAVFERNPRFTVPDSASYLRSFTPNMDGSGQMSIVAQTHHLLGFNPNTITSLRLDASQSIAMNQNFSMALPTTLVEWTALEFPSITMEFFDDNAGSAANIVCQINTFSLP